MTSFALAFGTSFLYVGLKAMQQLNVVNFHWWWVLPTSLGLATCEVYLVVYMVSVGPQLLSILSIGLGAGLGALASMMLYRRFYGTKH